MADSTDRSSAAMKDEFLAYFKNLIEGKASQSWRAWWKDNDAELQRSLPRTQYLQLKFRHLREAERLLNQYNIPYEWTPTGRRELYYARLHEDVLDNTGRPSLDFMRAAYDGAGGAFMEGDVALGNQLLRKYVQKLTRRRPEERKTLLEDMVYDGEMALDGGDEKFGRSLLETVAELAEGDDLTDFAVTRAKDLLRGI